MPTKTRLLCIAEKPCLHCREASFAVQGSLVFTLPDFALCSIRHFDAEKTAAFSVAEVSGLRCNLHNVYQPLCQSIDCLNSLRRPETSATVTLPRLLCIPEEPCFSADVQFVVLQGVSSCFLAVIILFLMVPLLPMISFTVVAPPRFRTQKNGCRCIGNRSYAIF